MSIRLAKLFDDCVATHAVHLSEPLEPLLEGELALVARAVQKRRHEFRAGRHCARNALARLGFHPQAILSAADRTALWPRGSVGSITHTSSVEHGFAAAVVALDEVMRGLGLDTESAEPLSPDLYTRVLTGTERDLVEGQAAAAGGRLAKLLFSAKEAFYTCQYCVT
jgi:4'-phosphopantetheinyl transferase EntD